MTDDDEFERPEPTHESNGYIETPAEVVSRLQGRILSKPTVRNGVSFRSHLEVRFAYHLDSMGEKWTYEPRRYSGYLPDFEITSAARPTFIELKPTLAEVSGAKERIERIWKTVPDALLIVAVAEECTFYSALKGQEWVTWNQRWRT